MVGGEDYFLRYTASIYLTQQGDLEYAKSHDDHRRRLGFGS
jgi:hypothetical protein